MAVKVQSGSLTVEQVVEAALVLVDNEGLTALNARRLGVALGVSAMTPYSYVDNRDHLLELMIARALPAPDPAGDDPTGPWQTRLESILVEAHDALVRHPGVLELLMSRTMAEPGLDHWRERVYGILRCAGLDDSSCARAGAALTSLLFGSIVVECFRARRGASAERERMTGLPAEQFPNLRRMAGEYVESHEGSGAFRFGLRSMIARLEAELAESPDAPGV